MIGWLTGRLGSTLAAYAAVVAVVIIAGLSGTLYLTGRAYLNTRDELATVRADLGAAQEYNDSLTGTVETLRQANTDFAEACTVDLNVTRAEVVEAQRRENTARAEATRLGRDLRRLANADPTVDAWLRARVPAAAADGLRRDAASRPH